MVVERFNSLMVLVKAIHTPGNSRITSSMEKEFTPLNPANAKTMQNMKDSFLLAIFLDMER